MTSTKKSRYISVEEKRERKRLTDVKYDNSQKGIDRRHRHNRSVKGHATNIRYNTSPKGKERAQRYRHTVKYSEVKRNYMKSPKGRDTNWRRRHGKSSQDAR